MIEPSSDPPVAATIATIDGYDRIGLAAGVGALELLPENAHQLLRTGLVARATLGLPKSVNGSTMSSGRWRQLMNSPPVASELVLGLEDPLDDLMIEEVVLPVGAFRLSSGNAPEGVWILQQLAEALTRASPPIDRKVLDEALQL